jgi:glycosyltransferase involved in cell wall biosynthesis
MRPVHSHTAHPSAGSPRRLHVLILTDRDWTHPQGGGTGTNLFGQVAHWLHWGQRVTVISGGYPGARALDVDGALTIHRHGGRSTVFPQTILRQWRGLVPDADVVLEVVNGITFLTPLWLRTPRVALVHHIHRRHYVEEMGGVGRVAGFALETAPLALLYRRTRFLTVSASGAADVAAHGIRRSSIEVNHNGVETTALVPGVRSPSPSLLYLGRLKRYKHVEDVIAIVVGTPGVTLDVVGDGEQGDELMRLADAEGVADRVRFHGHVDEETKIRMLQSAWVNVTASVAEGWSLSVMEAAACGTPSVALAIGGLVESIQHERTGLLAEDPNDLGRQVRRLLDDAELRERLGRAARERSLTFTWEATARRTLEALGRAAGVSAVCVEPPDDVGAEPLEGPDVEVAGASA